MVVALALFGAVISISHACEDLHAGATPSTQEMWETIRALQAEVAELKANSGGGQSGEFFVDGLWFNRSGTVASKTKRANTSPGQSTRITYEYEYDNQGRILSITSNPNSGFIQRNSFSYSGKVVLQTHEVIYDPTIYPNSKDATSTSTNEYY